jgi:hypothetical protein
MVDGQLGKVQKCTDKEMGADYIKQAELIVTKLGLTIPTINLNNF